MIIGKQKQKGLTFISLLFVLIILGFLLLLGLKIVPIYLGHHKVVSALKGIETTPDILSKSSDEIKLIFSRRLDMNYVSTISVDDIKITKKPTYLKMELKYEVVKQVLGNASVLVNFDDAIEVGENS